MRGGVVAETYPYGSPLILMEQGAPLPAEVSLAPHPCRFLAHKSTETEKEEADEGAEHETDLALLLSSLAPVLAK